MGAIIKKIRLQNFKRFRNYVITPNERINILVGDNEVGKSSVLEAIDIVASGNIRRVEAFGMDRLLNIDAVREFLQSDKQITELPILRIELYLEGSFDHTMNGKNNVDRIVCDGVRLICEPNMDYITEIKESMDANPDYFPYDYYTVRFSTFADEPYTGYKKKIRSALIDSTRMSTEYALNKIGVITNWFDLRMDKPTIVKELKETNTKMLLVFDEYLPQFERYLDELNLVKVITVSKADSLPMHLKMLAKLKKPKRSTRVNVVAYWDFVNSRAGVVPETVKDAADLPAIMEHTGGTTGTPKAVVLTNRNATSVMWQYHRTPITYSKNDRFMTVAFPFVAYTLICSLHNPLINGMECYLTFSLDMRSIEKTILRNRINHMAYTPIIWEQMIHSRKTKKTDLSFMNLPIVGADALPKKKEEEINNFLYCHHCKYKIAKGYGMTEVGSAVSVTPNNDINKIGSVGIPFPKTIISIFDTESGNECLYNEDGEICISGPSVMQGYFNRPEETAAVLKWHEDGRLWMHSGDLGYMDEDGFLFIKGRIKRMFMDHMGFKIFAPLIEEVLMQHGDIDRCCVVGTPDKEYGIGQKPVAFLILKENAQADSNTLRDYCKDRLPEYQVPSDFIFETEFPYTAAQKVDYRALEERYAAR